MYTQRSHINSICRILLGYRYDLDDSRFAPLQEALSSFRLQTAAAPIEHRAAWLRRWLIEPLWPTSISANRRRNISTLTTVVRVAEDTKIGKYDIKKGTVVFPNLMTAHRDHNLWKNPEEFNPSRFLNPDGRAKTRRPDGLLSFSVELPAAPEAFQAAAPSLPAPVATRAALDSVDTPELQAGAPLLADVANRATPSLGTPEPQPGPAPVRVQPPRARQPPKRYGNYV
ncbi:hypothetical protein HPB49_020767 [Dermacentor silvarum]|uniref:Uncharacterized protein n=1 Tax=Dermacentor silvarum TaxID=543639 RepID=A0ACB8CZT7_DERSI|nr:hypothetical protein HPB49_020767 [Dermacentor silvarum]